MNTPPNPNEGTSGQPKQPDTTLSRRKMLQGAVAFAGMAGIGGIGTAGRAIAQLPPVGLPVKEVDFVIIGAGFSGLAAAKRLADKGVSSFVVLEAQNRVGGRGETVPAVTVELPEGTEAGFIDQGAQFIGPAQENINALAELVGVKTFSAAPRGGDSILVYGGQTIRFNQTTMQGIPPEWAESREIFEKAEKTLDDMARNIDVAAPWGVDDASKEQAIEWDSMTLATWLKENVRDEKALYLFKTFVHGYVSAEARDFSLLHFLFYLKAGGLTEKLHSTGLANRFDGGVQQICDKVWKRFFPDKVVLGAPVKTIEQIDHGGKSIAEFDEDGNIIDPTDFNKARKVRVTTVNGTQYECKRVIVAMSPTMTGKFSYNPPMPANRIQLTQRIPMGSAIKCHCVYEKPFWLDKGLSAFVYFEKEPFSFLLDNSPPDNTRDDPAAKKPLGIIVGFLEAQEARNYADKPHDEVRKLMVDLIVKYLGEEGASPICYHQTNWAAKEWAGGCYAGIFPAGVWTAYPGSLVKPVGRIHWAGTETSREWYAYMDGAVSSGYRAAQAVIDAEGAGQNNS